MLFFLWAFLASHYCWTGNMRIYLLATSNKNWTTRNSF